MAWSQMVDGDLIGDRAAVGVGEVDPQCRECSVAVGVIGVIGVIGDGDRRRVGGGGDGEHVHGDSLGELRDLGQIEQRELRVAVAGIGDDVGH